MFNNNYENYNSWSSEIENEDIEGQKKEQRTNTGIKVFAIIVAILLILSFIVFGGCTLVHYAITSMQQQSPDIANALGNGWLDKIKMATSMFTI